MGILLTIWRGLKLFFWFCIDNWKVVVPIVALVILGLWLRSCWSAHKAKLNEQQIEKAKEAIAEHNDEKLKQVFAEADAKQAVIDGTVANSDVAVEAVKQEAKKKYDKMTPDELAAELEARK